MNYFRLYVRRVQYRWHTSNMATKIRFIASVCLFIFIIIYVFLWWRKDFKKERMNLPNQDDIRDENPAVTRKRIKSMMLHAWHNYARLTWGANELRPISGRPYLGGDFGAHRLGATIIESMDTLHIMGLHKELNRSRDWIDQKFTLDRVDDSLSVYELTSRLLAPMLTLYSLTGDDLYKNKAIYIANKILPAFDTPTGIPWRRVVPKEGSTLNRYLDNWALLSEYGALHLEFFYLSEITGSSIYKDRVEGIRITLSNLTKTNGLYPNSIDIKTRQWGRSDFSMHRYYDYLLKSWIQSARCDAKTLAMFQDAMLAVVQNMVVITPDEVTYVSEVQSGNHTHRMTQMACFSGALFVQGAIETLMKFWEKYMLIGIGIVESCYKSFTATPTHIGPEVIGFSEDAKKDIVSHQLNYYNLRPEVAESYMLLYRLTRDDKYRTWGLELVGALEKYCRAPGGYNGIMNVYDSSTETDDVQRSFFLGATLKYLYLLFSGDYVIPLHQWVFNSRGHFLPIKEINDLYREYNFTTMNNNIP
ncbi:uncharacterized protein Dana_GF16219 [Drosophila ananassae]|uniref:alpha-1,2-Mannosidase n=1 Tax=Drosophila ananassae TaxID=7217 RepID=B3LYV2_DROAN|nr:mannosyl-oligosaccharide alpha-1,2-mannosidase IA [Drosophila ananassae]EDV44068.2 uncharacterized protein Dana_GF16219 [Drosophila ananassae]